MYKRCVYCLIDAEIVTVCIYLYMFVCVGCHLTMVRMSPPPNTPGLMSPAQVLLPAACDEIIVHDENKCPTLICMEYWM